MKNLNYCYINNLKINNIEKNKNIIDYLESLNIKIPHFCYHPNLSVAGNCRMCLVELKNSPKPLISCSMLITNKMEIYTDSPLVKKARENILEFLLLNHPLDCPICDQGGECDLQDQSMVFGTDKKRFYNYKRSVSNKNLGLIVKTVMTRCIHCTRCVRFSNEISGSKNLGTFGRGNNMEIGTYVNEIFNSELSGNVIDICPVGALTSKSYSFFDRVWELKSFQFIDFTDGFCLNVNVYVKNKNNITKILPVFNNFDISNSWISDKTRFSFDSMFSNERISNIILFEKKKQKIKWSDIFKEIIYVIYFKDHLIKHFFKTPKLITIINNNLNIEILNFLFYLERTYNFFNIRKLNNTKFNIDINSYSLINSSNNNINLNKSMFCLMLGVNTRFEGSIMNTKIRQRYLKGNFKIFSLNSLIDFNFPTKHLGSNLSIFHNLIEGNHFLVQEFKNTLNPLIIYNSNIFNRQDSFELQKSIKILQKYTKILNKNWNGFNQLNTSINESGLNYLKYIKSLVKKDLKNLIGFYLIETELNSNYFKNLIELKLLNYIKTETFSNNFLITQNLYYFNNNKKKYKNIFKIFSNFFLPTTNFYENTGVYYTTEGIFKKTIKIIPSVNQSKNTWQITRRLMNNLENVNFLFNNKSNIKINLINLKKINFYKKINFLFFPFINFKVFLMFLNYKQINKYICKQNFFRTSQVKLYKTKSVLILDDFFLGLKEHVLNLSKVMIESSKLIRFKATNFLYLI